ncbi:unnamed protein product [Rotaria sp. Silwood1]|nr:unnamed protein product [Rotaria sp. Silwood1]CAF3451608.1 unnamed protein product [Rotaria sp. Silwood1]CAF3510733.1 unnamed protein product [Rotaria sp. Silwood1]CAF4579976.1 unnamed protein product [Rotaria sp. Silwood1]CAF4639379.1 unnamed protein product [Rotaria sp. Silwood1]
MIMIIMIFFLSGLIEHTSSIQCYTCAGSDYYCSLPLDLDAGDESNENNVAISGYDVGHACLSDHSFDARTGEEKLILRGVKDCEELNIPNHRTHCCYTDNCNKQLPTMITRTLADIMPRETRSESNNQCHISSIILIILNIFFQFFLLN